VQKLPGNKILADILLDQGIFSGSGNIIKNEVLHRPRLHPETELRELGRAQIIALIREERIYSFLFFEWKQHYTLKKNWEIYRQSRCKVCGSKVIRRNLGQHQRLTFYCGQCQPRFEQRAEFLAA
jgi:endonuclease-8